MKGIGSLRALPGILGRFFTRSPGRGWEPVEMKGRRGVARDFRLLDGAMSYAALAKGYIMIFGYPDNKQDLERINPMHVLLETSVENLSRFYPPEQAREIYCAYTRYNRL